MRPIDADELKNVLINEYELREGYFGEIILNAIDNTPTIESIQQDRWIPVEGIMDLDAVIEELKTKAEYNKFDNIIDYTIEGNTCTITINDINKIKLDRSKWYTKEDCDAKLARMQKCKKCDHEQCEDCDDGDHFVPGDTQ